jgi:Protein of unknown function (DUF4232)
VTTSVARWVLLGSVTALLTACTGSPGSSPASGSAATSASSAQAGSAPANSPSSGPAPSTPASASTPPVGSGASSPAGRPSVSVAGAWSGTGGACPDLQVKLGIGQGTSNTTYQVIDFVNHGPVACIMSGYPGVNLAGGRPAAPIGLPAAPDESRAARLIALPPGGVGNALLQITDARTYTAVNCGPVQAQYLIVYRPNRAAPVRLAYGTTACSQPVPMLQIGSISLGSGG